MRDQLNTLTLEELTTLAKALGLKSWKGKDRENKINRILQAFTQVEIEEACHQLGF